MPEQTARVRLGLLKINNTCSPAAPKPRAKGPGREILILTISQMFFFFFSLHPNSCDAHNAFCSTFVACSVCLSKIEATRIFPEPPRPAVAGRVQLWQDASSGNGGGLPHWQEGLFTCVKFNLSYVCRFFLGRRVCLQCSFDHKYLQKGVVVCEGTLCFMTSPQSESKLALPPSKMGYL